MACPFAPRRSTNDGGPNHHHSHGLLRQGSIVDGSVSGNWTLDDDCAVDIPDDALALTHLQLAIQLLTAPSNDNISTAIQSLIEKHSQRWPQLVNL